MIDDNKSIDYVEIDDNSESNGSSSATTQSPVTSYPSPAPSPSPGTSPKPSPAPQYQGPFPLSDPYPEHWEPVQCNLYDILWSDGTVTSEIRPVSDGVTPIGLCVIPTNWLDEGEMARFVSLKYMSGETPQTGSLTKKYLVWGAGYDKDSESILPFDNPEDDPLKKYYVPYACKDEQSGSDTFFGEYNWKDSKNTTIKDLREQENWLYTLNYCKNKPGVYAIGDINGKQNTINISIQGAYYENGRYPDMKSCVAKYAAVGMQAGYWYIPAIGELLQFAFRLRSDQNSPSINDKLAEIAKEYPKDCVQNFIDTYDYGRPIYWSSTVRNNGYVFTMEFDSNDISINSYATRGYNSEFVVAFLLR